MNAQERAELVDELLRVVQVVRKNTIANEARALIDAAFREAGRQPTEEAVEAFLADLFPWLFGPKSIMNALAKLAQRSTPPTGMEVYNLLTIAWRLDDSGVIVQGYRTYTDEKDLPRPDLRMAAER